MADAGTGWERDRRTHFDEIVSNYDRARPGYPAALIADIVRYAEPDRGGRALEIGAGTGKATQPMLDAGYDVTAVEIGENMARYLRERFQGRAGFSVVVSAFEEAELPEATYDLIYAASSFHWVDARIGCPKAVRLLRDGGTLALLRYNIQPTDDEALDARMRPVYDEHFHSYYTSRDRPIRRTHEEMTSPSGVLRGYGVEDLRAYGFDDIFQNLYEVTHTYSSDAYIALLDTMADIRGLPEANRAALYAGIRDVIRGHGGSLAVDCVFQLYMGRKG